jgi:hypothetical protein
MTRITLRATLAVLTLGTLALLACSSSSGTSNPVAPTDGGPVADATAADASTDSATTPDTSVPTGKGLIISNATVATLDGTYDIQVTRVTVPAGLAFNGNFDGKIEIEIDTDTAGAVKAAHVWNYAGSGMTLAPDKFYGCDGKATACTGVTVDVATNVITLGGVTWPEVESPAFDLSKPDVLVAGGGKVTVSGTIQAK